MDSVKWQVGRRSETMSGWVEPPSLELEIWFGDVMVAELHGVFPHQGTWFGVYDMKIGQGSGALEDRLLEYIAFCEDFHARIGRGEDHDFAEFDRFGPIADTSSWRVPLLDGGAMPMEGRMLFADGQAAWQHPEATPSTEAAASELWARIAQHGS
jgi:hypothetical protein